MTAFWAGPYATLALATLGADVIHIESVQRPDGMRFGSARTPADDQWWEFGPTFQHANVGKRSVTLDLTRPEGMELLHRLIGVSDALVENFSPRVMDQFGLDWEAVHRLNPPAGHGADARLRTGTDRGATEWASLRPWSRSAACAG